MYILIVHPDPDMILEIGARINKVRADGYDLSWKHAKTQTAALDCAAEPGEPLGLVITALEIPEDDRSSTAAGEQHRRGLELVQRLRTNNHDLAAIFVTAQVDNEVIAFVQSERCTGLIMEGAGFWDQLQPEIRKHIEPSPTRLPPEPPPAPPRPHVDLEIFLSTKDECSYYFQVEGQPAGVVCPLGRVDTDKLQDLVDQSREVHFDTPSWKKELKRIGEELADELFGSTPAKQKFLGEFHEWVGRVHIENIRVRFTVQDVLHPIVVEAFRERTDDAPWMLRTATYRVQRPQWHDSLEPRGLFRDEQTRNGPLNFLIIEANVPDNAVVAKPRLMLQALPSLEKEVAEVEALLASLRKPGGLIGEVRVIRKKDISAGVTFKERVKEVLREGSWHVLHYAGHTHYDPDTRTGYLFFPGPGGLSPVEAIEIDEFAWDLNKAETRFVFLSSCGGAQQDFVYHIAKERVPAILGFLWKVEDPAAGEYAKCFYRHLLGGSERSLEYACLKTKKDMHARHKDNPIWASSVLVMQVGA